MNLHERAESFELVKAALAGPGRPLFVLHKYNEDQPRDDHGRWGSGEVLNPKWKSYNDFQNEGGEGYNPHPKFIRTQAIEQRQSGQQPTPNRMLRDQQGNLVPELKLRASLDRLKTRLAGISDASAKTIIQASIDHAERQLLGGGQ